MNTLAGHPILDAIVLQYEVERFLVHESALLDARDFEGWLDLLADDLEYWMPVRSTRAAGDEQHEFAKLGEAAFFDDDKASIVQRVAKLRTGFAWAEDPPSRTRHFVSNVEILEHAGDDLRLRANFLIYRSRLARDEDLWVGCREDALRRNGASWLIVKRHIFVDQVSLAAKNLSIFF